MASPPFAAQWRARTTHTGALLRRPCAAIFVLVVILVTAACGGTSSSSAGGSGSSSTPRVIKIGSIHPLNTSIFPFSGPIEFDSHGENKNAQPIVMQVQNGNVMQVYPGQYAQAKPIFPATPWSGGTK